MPEIALESVVELAWLKLILPEPAPNAIVGVEIVPAASLLPKRPMFKAPEEPANSAIVVWVAVTAPPSATVRLLSVPLKPMVRGAELLGQVGLFVQVEPEPVTSTLLPLPERPM